MSNLKKVLSVGLASTMIMGMMATASAASYEDFTDKDEIKHKDAVSMVTELGVIAGLPGGSYGATQNIDRASFARLVCVALNGGTEPNLGNLKTNFTDTQGNWAEKYIAYCVQQGIIAGKGNNTFAPAANVTGSEAAKMLLVALGYNATYEGIGGATWQVTTDVLANQAGLYDGLEGMNTSEPLTRDNAAQMIYNTLNATMVKYEMVPGISTNGQVTMTTQRVNVTKTQGGTTVDVTMLSDKFGVAKYTGVVLANEYGTVMAADSANEGKSVINVTAVNDVDRTASKATYNVTTSADMLGKEVNLFVKTSNNKVVGAAVTSNDMDVYTITDSVKVGASGSDTIGKYLSDKDLTLDGSAKFVTNYAVSSDTTATTNNVAAPAGAVLTLVDNDQNGTIDYALLMQKTVGKVTVYNAKANDGKGSISISAQNGSNAFGMSVAAEKFEDVVGVENVAKDDIVLYYKLKNTYYVEKAESFEGKVTAIKGGEVTVDGTVYEQSGLVSTVDGTNALGSSAVTLGKSNTFYLDNHDNIVLVDDVEEASNYLIVTAKTGSPDEITGISAKVVLDDATTATVKVASVTTVGGDKKTSISEMNSALTANTVIYSYTVNSDKEYDLKVLAADNGITAFTNKAPALTGGTTVKTADNDTIFVVKSGDTYSVKTGVSNAPTVTSGTGVAYAKSGSVADIVFFTSGTTSSSDANAVFIASANATAVLGKDGDTTVYEYPAVVKGEITTVTATTTSVFSNGVGYYTDVAMNADGYYTVASTFAGAETVANVGGGVINGKTYGDDVKVYEVSSKGKITESDIGNVFDGTNGTTASTVVIVTKDTTGTDATVAQYIYILPSAVIADAPTSVKLAAHGTNGATVTSGPVTLNQGSNTAAVTGFADGSADCVKFDVTDAASTSTTIKVNGNSYTSGDSLDLGSSIGTVDYKVEVTVTQSGRTTTTYTYNVTITVA